MEKPSIPEFFSGKNIFLTGGSGFMGKVLIEKLLRSCPDIGNIYMLLRPKKGKSPEERISIMTDTPLFEKLKEINKNAIKKIVPISGDVIEPNLGISDSDREMLMNNVQIIFHSAASVRFDDSLSYAILLNTRGTREVVNLAKNLKNLLCFLHVSTTYCNTDRKVIGEEIYAPHADWRDSIQLAEQYDSHIFDILTSKYMGKLPNTYTFSKSLAEHVINDLCNGQLPAVIIRPSIVISSMSEPIIGWIDNFNGPAGLLVGIGKGVLRTLYTNPDVVCDYMPVDLVIKAMIMAAWEKGTEIEEQKKLELKIYNCSNNDVKPISNRDLVIMGKDLVWEIPLESMLWYPKSDIITKCFYMHYIRMIIYQLLPALFVDGALMLTGNKPLLIKIHRKVYIANMALQYFIQQQWSFKNEKLLELETRCLPCDEKEFTYDRQSKNGIPEVFFKNAMYGGKKYLMKETSSMEKCRKVATKMWLLAQLLNILWYLGIYWILFHKMNIVERFIQGLYDYKDYLNSP